MHMYENAGVCADGGADWRRRLETEARDLQLAGARDTPASSHVSSTWAGSSRSRPHPRRSPLPPAGLRRTAASATSAAGPPRAGRLRQDLRHSQGALRPVQNSNNIEATLSNATGWTIISTKLNVASTLLPFFDEISRQLVRHCMIVAKNGNNVEAAVDFVHRHIYGGGEPWPPRCQNPWLPYCHVRLDSRRLGPNWSPSTLQSRSASDFIKATFDFVEIIVRFVTFDNVASILLLVWTGLYVTLGLFSNTSNKTN